MENNKENKCESCDGMGKKRSFLKKALIVLVLLLAVSFIIKSAVKTYANYTNPRTITISGKGEVNAVPDVSTINFTIRVSSENSDTKTLQEDVANSANSTFAKLKELGIEDKDIKTTNYSVNPKYGYQDCSRIQTSAPCQSSTIVGYEASENVDIKVRNTENISKVLDILAAEKITEVNGPNFEVDDIEKLKDEARDIAIKDAKEKAKSLSKSLGVKIRDIIGFSDGSGNIVAPQALYKTASLQAYAEYGGPAMDSANIQAGEQKVTSNVSIIFQIED